jgi:hypothetical protein
MGHVLRANANAPWQVGGKDFADKSETKNEPVAPLCQSECSRAAVLVMICASLGRNATCMGLRF